MLAPSPSTGHFALLPGAGQGLCVLQGVLSALSSALAECGSVLASCLDLGQPQQHFL